MLNPDLSVKITELEEQLMEIEVTLNESNDLAIGEFEREYTDMVESFKVCGSELFCFLFVCFRLDHTVYLELLVLYRLLTGFVEFENGF